MLYVISPEILVALGAVFGAIVMTILLRPSAKYPLIAVGLGAIGGVAGTLLVMGPLQFCTFEAEREHLDRVLGAGLIVVAILFCLAVIRWFFDRFSRKYRFLPQMDTQQGAFRTSILVPFLLLLPSIVILLVFHYYPMFRTFELSTQLARLGAPRTVFFCLDNFTRLFNDPDYIYSVSVSFGIAAGTIVFAITLALLIATMAYLPIKGARVYRILLVWPYALSPVIAGIVFQLLFNPTAGVINYVLDSVFGFEVQWLLDPQIAPMTVVAASVWNILGFNILFYIAGLQNIPEDLLEAAAIDGANALQRFFLITVPLLAPITFFLVVTNTTYAFFDSFGLIDFLTTGGPSGATTTMMYDVYMTGIVGKNLGRAAAQSLLLFILVIVITVIQFRTSGNQSTYGR